MPLDPGARLGPYEIVSAVGAGGMGEVYKARDTRLDRTVAVKIASGSFSERFEREARAVAALNHPHICTLHDVGPNYLVMEYLEGETLAARIARGPIPFAETMKLALEMADALVAAHQKGITHRDIKPGNVMIVKSGAKLLDFGLARMERPISGSDETVTMAAMTTPGAIIGTFQYMSPEQLEGKEADARSDIFSFGALLYEMATGQKSFKGKSQVSLMAAILEHHPKPLSALQPTLPVELDRFIAVCLAKDPDERFQSAREVLRELKWIAEKPPAPVVASAAPQPAEPWKPNRWAYVAAAATLLAVAALIVGAFEPPPAPPPQVRFQLLPPDGVAFAGNVQRAAISPDGTQVAFNASTSGKVEMWVRPLDSTEARPIPGTEGSETPFWSPDSKSLGFFAGGKLKRVDVAGGAARVLCDAPANDGGGAWSPDGASIIFSGRNPDMTVHRVSASGGVAAAITKLSSGEQYHRWPKFLPDGQHFLYFSSGSGQEANALFAGSLDGAPPRRLMPSASHAEFASGYLLYLLDNALMSRRFDPGRLEFTGEPQPLVASVGLVPNGRAGFSVSSNGYLVLAEGHRNVSDQVVWVDRSGKPAGATGEPGTYSSLSLSPDGKQIAVTRAGNSANADVWIMDLARQVPSRITFDSAADRAPVWSPDGRTLVFYSERSPAGLYRKPASGLGDDELLLKTGMLAIPNDWSADGKSLLFQQGNLGTRDLYVLAMGGSAEGNTQPVAVQASPFDEMRGRFSPDGRWIAYVSNESGTSEVYVRSYPGNERKVQISNGGGIQPHWRQDGRELYFLATDSGALMAAPIRSLTPFEPGPPVALFEARILQSIDGSEYAPNADGSRFLLLQLLNAGAARPLTVVQNWTAGLRK